MNIRSELSVGLWILKTKNDHPEPVVDHYVNEAENFSFICKGD